ncbi:MAG: hypothetical protein ACLRVX_00575 [Faecalibacterium sp.]
MSKDKGKITRKRFVKLMVGDNKVQAREMRDMVFRVLVDPVKRMQEQRNREKHRRGAGRKG